MTFIGTGSLNARSYDAPAMVSGFLPLHCCCLELRGQGCRMAGKKLHGSLPCTTCKCLLDQEVNLARLRTESVHLRSDLIDLVAGVRQNLSSVCYCNPLCIFYISLAVSPGTRARLCLSLCGKLQKCCVEKDSTCDRPCQYWVMWGCFGITVASALAARCGAEPVELPTVVMVASGLSRMT